MTRTHFLLVVMLVLGLALTAAAQDTDDIGRGHGVCQFVDEDGDGFNDLAPDADGDGIPNGLDPDYECPGDGTGEQHAYQNGEGYRHGQLGDGEPHLAGVGVMAAFAGDGPGHAHAYGPGDGTGEGTGPGDGTGYGPGDGEGDGDCDGSGNPADAVQQRRSGRR